MTASVGTLALAAWTVGLATAAPQDVWHYAGAFACVDEPLSRRGANTPLPAAAYVSTEAAADVEACKERCWKHVGAWQTGCRSVSWHETAKICQVEGGNDLEVPVLEMQWQRVAEADLSFGNNTSPPSERRCWVLRGCVTAALTVPSSAVHFCGAMTPLDQSCTLQVGGVDCEAAVCGRRAGRRLGQWSVGAPCVFTSADAVRPSVTLSLLPELFSGVIQKYHRLSRFQELWAGVISAIFLIVLMVGEYKTKRRVQRTRRAMGRKAELDVLRDSPCGRSETAAKSIEIFKANCKPYLPFTGRKMAGFVDLSRADDAPLEIRHSRWSDLLDFQEYARYIAVAIRAEIHNLADEGVVSHRSGDAESHTMRDLLLHALDAGVLPEAVAADEEGQFVMSGAEAVRWLCDTYDRWRFGMRPGRAHVSVAEAKRFRTLAEALVRHLQILSPRCVKCNNAPKTVVLEPCRHLCCCNACSVRLTKCPLCRATIQQYIAGGADPRGSL